ncbi:MAG: helix-turn-helix domain-containing protein [Oscillospiraceae bacterium]|nr:helix-turn-helix domain-containing protein [Oscillospiraceae bacterium]
MIYLKTKQQVILKHRDGISNRQIAKDLGIDKNTVNKYVNEYDQKVRELMERDPTADSSVLIEAILEAPSYDTSSRHRKPSTEEAIEKIRYCLKENEKKRQEGRGKQQMRATDIHNYLTQTCGFEISYSHVKALKRELDNKENEAFIRQEYLPGAACEFDWGTVKLDIGRTGYHKYQMAAFASSYGNYRYAVLFRSQDTAAFQEAHVNFFHFCHGIYKTVVYDNMKVAVKGNRQMPLSSCQSIISLGSAFAMSGGEMKNRMSKEL